MKQLTSKLPHMVDVALALLLLAVTGTAWATIDGVPGPTFNFTAKADYVSSADGNTHYSWGYALNGGTMQYPGPTMIVNQGDVVTVNLTNTLPVPVSVVFPGQANVAATGGSDGVMTKEAAPLNGTVSYTFTASNAGTYLYHSGSNPALQVEMGLQGALVVRPNVANALHQAYGHPGTAFDREYLFLLSEMDPAIHAQVEAQVLANPLAAPSADMTAYHPVLWFINGRNAPDTILDAYVPWLPTQPYNSLPRMHPGEKLLMRVVNAGRDLHPFHTHGNNFWVLAKDGRLLESTPGAGPDLAYSDFTVRAVPGETYDAIFEWTGKNLGWDIYGHGIADALEPSECPNGLWADPPANTVRRADCDHGLPLPITMPNLQDISTGGNYSGSPFLGMLGALPPGVPSPGAGYFHMWHSHNEKELTNHDIFPGGMMTMLIIEPWGVTIP